MRPIEAQSARGSAGMDRDERLHRLGRVTGELLHDLAGSLAVLSGRVSLARAEASLGRLATDELARIGADADELRAMVLDVLGEVRGVRTPAEATFPVRSTLDGVVNRWLIGAPRVSVSLRSSLPANAEISGPRTFFVRALGNLLRNAARHAHGEIRIAAVPVGGGDWVEIEVEDDGDGVPEDLRSLIFEPFITGTELGTGLGLSFARWGIERLGGSLELKAAKSSLGGASFRVSLPLSTIGARARGPTVAAPDRPTQGPGPLRGFRIAVVDDDEAVRTTFTRLLERSGAETEGMDPTRWDSLEAGMAALAAFAPNVILLDLTLGPYSGPDLARIMRERASRLFQRVIYFTGGADPGPMDRPIVSKLLPWEEILNRLRRVALASEGRDRRG